MASPETTLMTDFDDDINKGLNSNEQKRSEAAKNLREVASDPKAKKRMIMTAGVVVAAVVVGSVMFSNSSSHSSLAIVNAPKDFKSATTVTDKVSPEYAKLMNMQNAEGTKRAELLGTTHIDAIVPGTLSEVKPKEPELQIPMELPPPEAVRVRPLPDATVNVQASVPVKAEVNKAMNDQMKALLGSWGANKHATIYLAASKSTAVNADNAANTTSAKVADAAKLKGPTATLKAGDMLNAVLMLEANSDTPGPIMAQIISGKYAGAKMIGSFKRGDERVTMEFTTLSLPYADKSISVSAIAVDPTVGSQALSGDVDHHWFERYGLPFIASFIGGMGDAIAKMGSVQTNTGTGATVTTSPTLNTTEKASIALGTASSALAKDIAKEGKRQITVVIPNGTPVGIMFMANTELPEPAKKDGE